MSRPITGATLVAGVAGSPVAHSLSPLVHNAWIAAAGLDAVYVAFAPHADGFRAFAEGLRGGAVRGLNVTIPFKADALAVADRPSDRARRAGAANLLIFEADGTIVADNTDGIGLLAAFAGHDPKFDPAAGPVVVVGAGGAARGAAAAFLAAGAPELRIVNRTRAKADAIALDLGSRVQAFGLAEATAAFAGAAAVINATSVGLTDPQSLALPLHAAPDRAVAMDMVYGRSRTAFLVAAAARGLATVDGLDMLIGQASPSFEAFFGRPPPPVDVRALALAHLQAGP
ncbi:shikimate dehydrogenase [Phenylobacterium sp.]|jgi:shikimate dehydrogenase|uniref:shikimate dehydrogenase family protein n=1 Tax=Phenylobacterium sp. TaxID=1871053 RepID=UPI002F41B920